MMSSVVYFKSEKWSVMEHYQKIRFLNEVDQIIHLQPTPSQLLTLLPFIQQDLFGALAYQMLECPFPNAACPQMCPGCSD